MIDIKLIVKQPSMLFTNTISSLSFKHWIWKDKENKKLFWVALTLIVISFTWLKFIYPFPNFMPPDSYSYLEAAAKNEFIDTWPIGYSRFLRLVSSFSNSHFVLVTIQYLLLIAAILYFLFSIRYMLSPGKWLFRVLLVISIGNPLLPHIANFVSSDCLFTALSLLWFTQLMWILYQPTKKILLLHAFVLLLAFMVRFMAIYYPILSFCIILLKPMPRKTKWLGIATASILLLVFIGCTQYEYKLKTDTIQYSAFGGWQLAANALYGYAHSLPDTQNIPSRFRELHTLVNRHMDSIRHLTYRPDREVAIYYLWDFKSPLRVFMNQQNRSTKSWFKKWASMAPLYQKYGRWLIRKHPLEFARYYLWPNLLKYYAPPVKFMGSYNLKSDIVRASAVTWFGWNSNKLPTRAHDRTIHIVSIFPTLLAIINPLFLLASIAFIMLGGFSQCNANSKKNIGLLWLTWIANMCFSVFSAPIELRYQLFPLIITIPFCGLFIQWIFQYFQPVPIALNKQQRRIIPDPSS
jgi:hypothetical protein